MTIYDKLPNDPVMLLSFLNTQLRDHFPSLEELASSYQLNMDEIAEKMKAIDYEYNASVNQFI